ncbi:MAG: hypothetical protein E4G94_03255, partial [ANME-2 cluster archaeon]
MKREIGLVVFILILMMVSMPAVAVFEVPEGAITFQSLGLSETYDGETTKYQTKEVTLRFAEPGEIKIVLYTFKSLDFHVRIYVNGLLATDKLSYHGNSETTLTIPGAFIEKGENTIYLEFIDVSENTKFSSSPLTLAPKSYFLSSDPPIALTATPTSSTEKYDSEPIFAFPSNADLYLEGINKGTMPMVESVPFTINYQIKTDEDREKLLEAMKKEMGEYNSEYKETLANIYLQYGYQNYENRKYEEAKTCSLMVKAISEELGDTDLIDKAETLNEDVDEKIETKERNKLIYELILALIAAIIFGYLFEKKMKNKLYIILSI